MIKMKCLYNNVLHIKKKKTWHLKNEKLINISVIGSDDGSILVILNVSLLGTYMSMFKSTQPQLNN